MLLPWGPLVLHTLTRMIHPLPRYEGWSLLSAGPGPLLPHTAATVELALPLNTSGLFFRGGSILPAQVCFN